MMTESEDNTILYCLRKWSTRIMFDQSVFK